MKRIASGNFSNQFPLVTTLVVDGVQDVSIFYTRAPITTGVFMGSSTNQQVVKQKLSRTLGPEGDLNVLFSNAKQPLAYKVVFRVGKLTLLLSRETKDGKTLWFLDLAVNGRIIAKERESLGEVESITVTQTDKGDPGNAFFVLVITDSQQGTFMKFGVVLKEPADLDLQDGITRLKGLTGGQVLFKSLFLPDETAGVRAGAADTVSFYVATAEGDGRVRNRAFSQNGKLAQIGDPVQLFRPGNAIQSLDAVGLDASGGGPNAALVWTKAPSPTRQEIRVHLFTAAP